MSCQKCLIRLVVGCLECTTIIWNAMVDSGVNQKSLRILWLDLANAYGMLPYKLIEYALEMYGIPSQ